MTWCSSCTEDVAAIATLSGSGQIVEACSKCNNMLGGGALTAPLAATGVAIGEAAQRVIPVIKAKPPAEVVALPSARRATARQASISEPLTLEETMAMLRARESQLEGERVRILADQARLAGVNAELRALRKILAAQESK